MTKSMSMGNEKQAKKAVGVPAEKKENKYDKYKGYYAERRKKNIENKKNGNRSLRRLYFLEHIIKSQKLTWEKVAKKCGVSQQSISWMIISDDAKLSRIKDIMKALDSLISLEYVQDKKVEIESENGPRVEIRGQLYLHETIEPIVEEALDEDKNLYFLARFLTDKHISLLDLSKKTGIPKQYIKRYFEKDDMRISTIYEIAEIYDLKIIWNLDELESDSTTSK